MKLPRGIFLGILYLAELALVLVLVVIAVNLRGFLSAANAGASASATQSPTVLAPVPANSATVLKNVPVNVDGKFQLTYVGDFRDPVLYGPSPGDQKQARGMYGTIQFRVKNLQTVSDSFGAHYGFVAITEDGTIIPSDPAAQANAAWQYCQCDTDQKVIPPGGESVFVVSFDVPATATRLIIGVTQGSSTDLLNGVPRFSIVNFDKIPAWQAPQGGGEPQGGGGRKGQGDNQGKGGKKH